MSEDLRFYEMRSSNVFYLQIIRQAGSFGAVNVTWVMFPASQNTSLNYANGTVTFVDGQLSADLTINVVNDMKPTLDTLYFLTLTNVSQVIDPTSLTI